MVPSSRPGHVHTSLPYTLSTFRVGYERLVELTDGFTAVGVDRLANAIEKDPMVMLPLRIIVGFTPVELAMASALVAEELDVNPLSPAKVNSMERSGSRTSGSDARLTAITIDRLMFRTDVLRRSTLASPASRT